MYSQYQTRSTGVGIQSLGQLLVLATSSLSVSGQHQGILFTEIVNAPLFQRLNCDYKVDVTLHGLNIILLSYRLNLAYIGEQDSTKAAIACSIDGDDMHIF